MDVMSGVGGMGGRDEWGGFDGQDRRDGWK